jgi:hypothetical protein
MPEAIVRAACTASDTSALWLAGVEAFRSSVFPYNRVNEIHLIAQDGRAAWWHACIRSNKLRCPRGARPNCPRECVGARTGRGAYVRFPATVSNIVDMLLPTSFTAAMITTLMSAVRSPYSIAVAPAWSAHSREICFTSVPLDTGLSRKLGRGNLKSA